jgi:hypothetical protein
MEPSQHPQISQVEDETTKYEKPLEPQFDAFPMGAPDCPVRYVTVQAHRRLRHRTAGQASTRETAYHVAKFTGLWDVVTDEHSCKGQVLNTNPFDALTT